jgi:hypothetical protein
MELERSFAMSAERFAPKPGAAEARRIIAADPRADGRRREVMLARGRVQIARSVAGVRL